MGFMDSYKRLDNLCKTFPDYPKGISSYIEVMERCMSMRHQCPGWSSDYARLKKYRYIRNKISHDNGAYEDNLCTHEDEQWLQDFHTRLLNSDDPVALYFKSLRASSARPKQTPKTPLSQSAPCPQPTSTRPQKQPVGCAACFVLIILITVAVGWFVLHI